MRISRLSSIVLIFFVVIALYGCQVVAGTNPVNTTDELSWPQITSQTRPWSRWWWMGSIVNEHDLTVEMEKYAEAGLGGLEITPIYGVKGYEDRFIDYLTPKWVGMLEHSLKEAERLDMGIDMATGNGWPFGGQWVRADIACKNMVHKTYTLSGGETLGEPVIYIQKPMVRAIGRRIDISEIKEPISSNENLQALALEQVRFEKPLPLQVLMAYSEQGKTVELTDRVDSAGKLNWTAPDGNWTLYAIFQGWHGKMVERAGPGGEGNVIDHFSQDALKTYLAKFDQAYVGHDVGSLRAYFNDSYEVDDASGESNWTDKFFEEFQARRGYDLCEHLPALFGKDSDDKNSRVMSDYRETISDLLLERFTIPWSEWAASKGAITRNQAHGSPANLLDLYAASDIPETEGSDILGFKFASSAAHVTGKPLASCEAATWLNGHFLSNLGDVKTALDSFFLGGINHICYHGTTFSPPDEDWPGWMFYASVHFGPTNSFWNDFSALNMYVTRCQSFLQAGQPDNDVLLYFPIYDQWSQTGGRGMLPHFRASAPGAAGRDGQEMLDSGYTFDFISDRQLINVEYTDNALQIGGVLYKAVVVPECRLVPPATFEKLLDLARDGADVILHDGLPSDVPGWWNLDGRRDVLQNLIAQLDFAATDSPAVQIALLGDGKVLVGDNLSQLLSYAGIKREPMVDSGIRFIRRSYTDGCYYFLNNYVDIRGGDAQRGGDQRGGLRSANIRNSSIDDWIPIASDAKSVAIFNPMGGKVGLAAIRKSDAGTNEVYLQLDPGQSCILKTFDTQVEGPLYSYIRTTGQSQEIEGTWAVSFIEGGPELPQSVEIEQLGSWTQNSGEAVKKFSGTAKYSISFPKPLHQAEGWMLDLGGVCESAVVIFNGRELGTLIGPKYQIRITNESLREDNTLEIMVSNLMANRIADMDKRNVNWKKFYNVNFPARLRSNRGPDGLFNASNWTPRDSGLIGPVTLIPFEFLDL
jgi:hypothetical protein